MGIRETCRNLQYRYRRAADGVRERLSYGLDVRHHLRLLDCGERMLPDFLIIGAQKSGTTSLYHYLTRHPRIQPALRKEVHYFDLHYDKSKCWYRAFFPRVPDDDGEAGWGITGEASPYYLYHPDVPGRIKEELPSVKLLVLLRDPVVRAYSHYEHCRRKRREFAGSFEEALARESDRLNADDGEERGGSDWEYRKRHFSYVDRGRYIVQLDRWMEFWNAEDFLVLRSEDLFEEPEMVLGKVWEHLGVERHQLEEVQPLNVGAYAPMESSTREYLQDVFRPFNSRLESEFGVGWRYD